MTLPSVRWGLFIRGVSRLSFIVDALSFLPSLLPVPLLSSHSAVLLPSYVSSLCLSPSPFVLFLSRYRCLFFPARYQLHSGSYLFWINASGRAVPEYPLRCFEHCLPTAPVGVTSFPFLSSLCVLDLSLSLPPFLSPPSFVTPIFWRATLHRSRIDAKADSRKRRITKWSVTAGTQRPMYTRCRARFTLLSRTSEVGARRLRTTRGARYRTARYAYHDEENVSPPGGWPFVGRPVRRLCFYLSLLSLARVITCVRF